MRALRQALGVLRQLSPGDCAVPFGMRDVFARLLVFVGALRSEAEDRVPLGDGNAPNRCPRKGGNRNGKTGMKRSCQLEFSLALQAANRRQSPLFAGSKRTTGRLGTRRWRTASREARSAF